MSDSIAQELWRLPINISNFPCDHYQPLIQRAVFSKNNISKEYNLRISTKKTKVLGFKGAEDL
jgi:hypothetical protein